MSRPCGEGGWQTDAPLSRDQRAWGARRRRRRLGQPGPCRRPAQLGPGPHGGPPGFGEVQPPRGTPAAPGLRAGCGPTGDDLRRGPGRLSERRRHGPVPASADPDPIPFERRMGSAVRACHRPRPEGRLRGHLPDPARAGDPATRSGSGAHARPDRAGAPVSDLYNNPIGHWVVIAVAMTLLLFVVLTATAYTVWFERVALGRIQRRPGPNRVGPFGLMQLAADGVKLAFKESFVPEKTDKVLYVAAPAIAVVAAFLAWSVIPIGLWYNVQYWIADVNVGILVVFAVSALNVYAIVIGGDGANNDKSPPRGPRPPA